MAPTKKHEKHTEEAFGAVAALQQEAFALGDFRQLRLQGVHFFERHQGRQASHCAGAAGAAVSGRDEAATTTATNNSNSRSCGMRRSAELQCCVLTVKGQSATACCQTNKPMA